MKILTEAQYAESSAINYSLLAALDKHPLHAKAYLDGIRKESTALSYGSLVDCLITAPEEFTKRYFPLAMSMPTDKGKEWADLVYKAAVIKGITDVSKIPDTQILISRTASGYDSRLKDETAINRFKSDFMPYVGALMAAEDRIVVTKDDYMQANFIVNQLQTSPVTRELFPEDPEDFVKRVVPESRIAKVETEAELLALAKEFGYDTESDYIYQMCLEFESDGQAFKIKPDLVIVNHKEKTIRIIDFKTCQNVDEFISNYIKYRYYLQAALYTDGVYRMAKKSYSGYTVSNLEFAVIDETGRPLIYTSSNDVITVGLLGGTIKSSTRYVRGISGLAEDLLWHIKENAWNYTKDQYLAEGRQAIDVFKT